MTETKLVYPVGNYSIFLVQDSDQSPNLACAALLILLVLTLTLNSLVLMSVLGSPLRSTPYNASIAAIVSVSLVDGIINLTSSVVFHASWLELYHFYEEDTVRGWCRSNAATLQITGMSHSFALGVLSYDRLSSERRTILPAALKWMLFLSIFAGVILALPVAFGALAAIFFEQRMSCSPAYASKQPGGVLLAVVILLTYVTTWFFTLRNSYAFVKKILTERRRQIGLELVARQRAAERGSPQRIITNSNSELGQIWKAANGESVLTGFLIAAFILAVVPYISSVQVTQFYVTYNIPQEFYVTNRTVTQVRTDIFDSIFAWTRHGYNVFSPGIILLLHDEIRQQCKITFCCCFGGGKTHLPEQFRSVPAFVRRKKKKNTVADYKTPVLFATSEGLHLRTVRGDRLEQEESQFVIQFCDVTLDEVNALSKQQTPVQVKPRHDLKLNETFVVKQETRSFGETFVKSSDGFDISKNSRNRSVELRLIAENGTSLLSLSQRMRIRNS